MVLIPSCFGPEALQVPKPRFLATARGDGSNRSTTAHSNGDSTETERLEQLRGVQQLCLVILAEYLHYTNSWHLGEKLGVLGFEWREAQRVISGHSSKARICKRGTTSNLHVIYFVVEYLASFSIMLLACHSTSQQGMLCKTAWQLAGMAR